MKTVSLISLNLVVVVGLSFFPLVVLANDNSCRGFNFNCVRRELGTPTEFVDYIKVKTTEPAIAFISALAGVTALKMIIFR